MLDGKYPVQLIVKLDIPSEDCVFKIEDHLEEAFANGILDGYYFLTRNKVPVVHRDEHLEPENRLGCAIAAIQNDDILIRSLADNRADSDPETGIEYGDLT